MEMRRHLANLWTVRGGQIVKMEAFADQQSGLETLGLSEQDAHADS